MNTCNLPIEMIEDTKAFSINDAIRHLVVQYNNFCPEAHIILDRAGLEARMPHRETALCIDFGFIPLDENAQQAFSVSHIPEDSFETVGHFPGSKRLPGHWIIEKMCLTATLTNGTIPSEKRSNRTYLPILTKIHSAEFLRPVLPGGVLVMRSDYQSGSTTDWRRPIFNIYAFTENVLCATLTFSAALVPARG